MTSSKITKTNRETIAKYGEQACLDALDRNERIGEGANTVGGGSTRLGDNLINAGRVVRDQRKRAVEKRIAMERQVVRAFVERALAAGYVVSVSNGEDFPVKKSASVVEIMAGIQQTDEEQLIVRRPNGERVGSVFLVYGNDGYDVISDYTTPLEPIMPELNELIDRLAENA